MKLSRRQKKLTRKQEKQNRFLSQAIQLEEAVNPHIVRATMSITSLAIVAFLIWAAFTSVHEITRTPGEVVPQGYQQSIQHLEGGIVDNINVKEGDFVSKGQTLIKLSSANVKEDLERAYSRHVSLELQAERLRAFVEEREPDFSSFANISTTQANDQKSFFRGMVDAKSEEKQIVLDQIDKKKRAIKSYEIDLKTAKDNLEITRDIYQKNLELNRKGYSSDVSVMEQKQEINRTEGDIEALRNKISVSLAEIREFNARLRSLSATQTDQAHEKLDVVLSELSENKEIIDKLQERISRLEIRSPVDGIVKGLAVNTVGGIVAPGQKILEVVPHDKELEVTVKISPNNIGQIKIGQPVKVKVSTFDFSKYGFIEGKLSNISATTFSKEDGNRYYLGRIVLDKNYVGEDHDNIILPGMTVMADIITGQKTILSYLLKPIQSSLSTAFTER